MRAARALRACSRVILIGAVADGRCFNRRGLDRITAFATGAGLALGLAAKPAPYRRNPRPLDPAYPSGST